MFKILINVSLASPIRDKSEQIEVKQQIYQKFKNRYGLCNSDKIDSKTVQKHMKIKMMIKDKIRL